jgi:hypothetical protein
VLTEVCGHSPSAWSSELNPLTPYCSELKISYLALPAGIVYGIVPLLQAQFMQLFTDRIVYTVSFKPKGRDNRRPQDIEKAIISA